MARVDLYRNVHLGQRYRLFALATELGAADAGDKESTASLAARCLAMTTELREHAEHEDAFIHPLLWQRAPEAAEILDREHEHLDRDLDALDVMARALADRPSEVDADATHHVYLALNRLISSYLAHLDAEERVAMPALKELYDDKELQAVHDAFVASRSPEEQALDLDRMLPALPPGTRAAIVGHA